MGAGGASHLAGVIAAETILPVIGVPMATTTLGGLDALLSTVQMPGGVPVAWEIATALGAALDVFLVRKLGVPRWSELAMGALASGGVVAMNDNVVSSLHITDEQVREVIDSETAELTRREQAYRGGRPVADPGGKIVILADDGIAKVSLVGAGMRTHPGVSATMFESLSDAGINIEMISTSPIRVSCVVRADRVEEAVQVIYRAFDLSAP